MHTFEYLLILPGSTAIVLCDDRGFAKFGIFGSDSLSDCSNKGTSYWIEWYNIATIFSVCVLNKEFVTLNLVFLKWNMIFICKLEQSDKLSDSNSPSFTKPRMFICILKTHSKLKYKRSILDNFVPLYLNFKLVFDTYKSCCLAL